MTHDPDRPAGAAAAADGAPDPDALPDWLDALDDLLAAQDSPLLAGSFDALCAAVAVSPQLLLPSDWLPAVWGDEGPAFADRDEMQAAVDLLMGAYNDVVAGLMDGTWQPLFELDRDGTPLWEIWIEGFAAGAALAPEAWAGLVEHRDPMVAAAAAVLFRLAELSDWTADADARTSDDTQLMAQAPDLIATAIHELQRARLAGYAAARPVRRDKVGRNDPCPCGSGRKYKKCCGA